MPDYKAETVTVERWQRCFRIVIENPVAQLGKTPSVDFLEEVAATRNGELDSVAPVAGCSLVFEPTATIPMRNPTTGELTGKTITQADAYAMLYSAYRWAADTRDQAQGGAR